jgi:hypothetical protein
MPRISTGRLDVGASTPFKKWLTPTGFMGSVLSTGSNASCCPGSCCHWNGTGHGGEVVLNVSIVVDGRFHTITVAAPILQQKIPAPVVRSTSPPLFAPNREKAGQEKEEEEEEEEGGEEEEHAAVGNWTQCARVFSAGGGTNCESVGLVEGGAGPAECESKCVALHNCTAFNVRMTAVGGCSLRNCAPGTAPSGMLPDFAGYANYKVDCNGYTPPPPSPPPPPPATYTGGTFSMIKYSMIGPLLSRQNVTVSSHGITQAYDYTVVGNTTGVQFLYVFMSMFNNATSEWVAGTNVGTVLVFR